MFAENTKEYVVIFKYVPVCVHVTMCISLVNHILHISPQGAYGLETTGIIGCL